MSKKLWWESGVQFECQGSGKCCVSHGEYGSVFLSKDDRKRMAKELKLSFRQFLTEHCEKTDEGFWRLKEELKNGDCRFLKNKRCSVYHARPTQCRTWPFWPEVMDAKSWKEDVASFCPGVGKGRVWQAPEIAGILGEQAESEKSMVEESEKSS